MSSTSKKHPSRTNSSSHRTSPTLLRTILVFSDYLSYIWENFIKVFLGSIILTFLLLFHTQRLGFHLKFNNNIHGYGSSTTRTVHREISTSSVFSHISLNRSRPLLLNASHQLLLRNETSFSYRDWNLLYMFSSFRFFVRFSYPPLARYPRQNTKERMATSVSQVF